MEVPFKGKPFNSYANFFLQPSIHLLTGKSYLGVVIVRGLLLLRSLWLKKTKTVGTPPILVLSYKNHAIDEFLVDLTNAVTLRSSDLIRIGGQCKDPRLAQFSEQRAYQSNTEVKNRRKIVERLDFLKESITVTMEGKVASFLSFRHLIFPPNDGKAEDDDRTDQDRRKAAVDATAILMESIGRWSLLQQVLQDGRKELEEKHEEDTPKDLVGKFSFLELGTNREAARALTNHVSASPGSKFIPSLDNGAAHYKHSHWGDVLYSWICGKVLLPKCQHCDQLSLSPDPALCDQHRCEFLSIDQTRCSTKREDDQTFCTGHSCQAEDCGFSRMPGGHRYCSIHACKKCISLGLEAEIATDDPPKNVCEKHPMCILPSCLEFSPQNEAYCSSHGRVTACTALNKKGKPCKGRAISRAILFCKDHLHLHRTAVLEELEKKESLDKNYPEEKKETPTLSKNCVATTRKGKPCKGVVLPGSKYCYDHSPPEAIMTKMAEQGLDSKRRGSAVDAQKEKGLDTPDTEEGLVGGQNFEKESVTAESTGLLTPTIIAHKMIEDDEGGDDTASATSEKFIDAKEFVCEGIDEGDSVEDEEGDNLQHLRDVFEVEDGQEDPANTDDEADEENALDILVAEFEISTEAKKNPNDWSWEMSLDERWNSCHALMGELEELLLVANAQTRRAINVARKDLRKAEMQAKARVYENRSVIGGTMVGCIHRLEAIKTTRPFAVVVEEASEVLEPLLFSCLSDSTVKLEMIGDHRQLQPSVQSRFDFEICNKINVSMFQRLIESPPGHAVPSTVLSVQRRMRQNICDLTRNFYSDITTIEDHETVHSQKIGQRNPSRGNIIASSATAGREVPGLSPHVFLWTHDGDQKRSQVGVSRINPREAEMACSLVAYLVMCGVPRSSIVVLTPYKGQLMLIRKNMLTEAKFSSLSLISRQPGAKDVVRVSTVDRFQGDEEDIVICSLVVDENSKTGFVKLVNRMIVLLSRARLGLYILGNVGYFEKDPPKHWAETFCLLQGPSQSDTDESLIPSSASMVSLKPRTGREIGECSCAKKKIRCIQVPCKKSNTFVSQTCAVLFIVKYATVQKALLMSS